ncbi:MAG: sodium:proton antiporter NhaD [Novosphingobium sp.]
MTAALLILFVITYAAIALEEPLKVNKAAAALLGAGLLWTVYALSQGSPDVVESELAHSLTHTAEIAFFLMGAMTIVEVIDTHDGFTIITDRIRAKKLVPLMWLVSAVTFFLSAILDNLTTTIVMITLLRKLVVTRENRLFLAGMVVIAANAGGAWSPMGDVTTTMLWIGGQVTAVAIVTKLILPSLVCALVPLAIASVMLRGRPMTAPPRDEGSASQFKPLERNLIFALGLGVLLAVPAFKSITHLPPYLGILFGLGILWAVADLLHRGKDMQVKQRMAIAYALTRIDMSAIIFFVGILLAVATLEHSHILTAFATWLDVSIGRLDVIVTLFGLLSAIVDNVPMVAAAMGMYSLDTHPPDSFLWEYMAYCAGTGGSILIIGSAAGVAAMSIERIEFFWYLKRFGPLAMAGYLAGAAVYNVQSAALG